MKPEITVEMLRKQIERAKNCSEATVPGDQLRAILELALRAKLAEGDSPRKPPFKLVKG